MSEGAISLIRVEGGSMSPMLLAGDSVAVEWLPHENDRPTSVASETSASQPAAWADLRPGELVITGNIPESSPSSNFLFVVHRVIRAGEKPLTKGDFAFTSDQSPAIIWGRVTGVRFQRETAIRPFRISRLDRSIAFFSRLSAGTVGLGGRISRKFIYFLGWLKRRES